MAGTSLEDWIKWKEVCAADLCPDRVRNRLGAFGQSRFRTLADRFRSRTNAGNASEVVDRLGPLEAWHLFESHVTVRATREGKRYKDWIFARTEGSADSPLRVIEAGASLIMRDVVRDHLRREFSPRTMVSLDSPVAGSAGESLTLGDLLPGSPDPADEAAAKEYTALACRHAEETFRKMTRRERVAMLSKHMGLSLAHNAVEQAAGCRHSILNTTYRRFLEQIGMNMGTRYRDDGGESVLALTMMTLDAIREKAFSWGKSENGCAELFNIVDGINAGVDKRGNA
jgi:hypothetical protein